jgi:hypothetical protein
MTGLAPLVLRHALVQKQRGSVSFTDNTVLSASAVLAGPLALI